MIQEVNCDLWSRSVRYVPCPAITGRNSFYVIPSIVIWPKYLEIPMVPDDENDKTML